MSQECKVCEAPNQIRALVEKLRSVGIPLRKVAQCVKVIDDYDLSHASVQRHELAKHFDPGATLKQDIGEIDFENLSLKTIVMHQLKKWWSVNRDRTPTDHEMRAWMKLFKELEATDAERERTALLKEMFKPKEPLAIEAEILDADNS